MRFWRQSTSFQLIVQTLCFCLLLQGSGIAQALPLPPKQSFVSKEDLDSARSRRATPEAERAEEPGYLHQLAGDAWSVAKTAGSRFQGWLEDAWAPASSAAGREAPLRVAQAGGTLPVPARLMPAVFAAPLQGGPPGPPSRAGADTSATPPAEAARLLEKAGSDEIPLIAGWNLISIPLQPADPDPAAVFAPIVGQLIEVAHVDVCDAADPDKIYDPADPAGSDLTAITPGMGLWVKVTAATILPLTGTLPAATTIELCPGWNHLGMPTGQPRHPYVVLSSVAGKWQRVFGHDAFDTEDPWEYCDPVVPAWANDMTAMRPGYGYWVLASEAVTLTISNQGPPPTIALAAPADLAVVAQPTQVTGTVDSDRLESWTLTATPKDDGAPVTLASGTAPVSGPGVLATFDPTLLLNGLYLLELTATDVQGQQVAEEVAVSVEGQMKIGHFSLSFVDLAIPVSGLAIEILRTYESRDQQQRDFGVGWRLDVRQGSYVNNRPPGDGWQLQTGFLPCDTVLESKSHLTVVRLSDQEVYRFALKLQDGASTGGGCFATARFDYVDGPLPGSTLEILGGTQVFWENGSNQVIDADSFELYEPQDVKLTTRDGRIFELDLTDGVTKLQDLNGNELTITPAGITHSSGKGIAFTHDAEGRVTRITDPLGREMSYGYDAAGDLASFTDRAGATSRYTYDHHRLLEIEDPRGIKPLRNEYDAEGRIVRHIDAFGKVIELEHDLDGRREVITNRLGASRVLEYDNRGNVVRETDELGKVTTRVFDARDNLLAETDPLNRTTEYTYSASNDLLSQKDPLGHETKYTYNGRGQLLTVTDPRSNTTSIAYDARGNLTSTTDALAQETSFTYTAAGDLETTTDALGHETSFGYDSFGNLTSETDALGHETVSTCDAAGNQLTETRTRTLADGSTETLVTRYTYDALDRVTSITFADGSRISTVYDLLGKVIQQIDQLGRSTGMAYDSMGRLVTTTYPDSTSTSQSYDAEGRLVAQVDRAGRSTDFLYDAGGRLVKTTFPDGSSTSNLYDDAGQLVASTDARSNTTSYEYDAAGRRTAVIDALGHGMSFGYDENGNQTRVTDARGHVTTFGYDELNRLATTTYPDDTTTVVAYDALGRRIAKTDQAGLTTEIDYEPLGRLTSVADALDQVTSYSYDELGNRLTQTDANAHTTRFEYDALGRQVARVLPGGARETMAYDAEGTLASHTDFNGATRTFEYDAEGRLTRRAYPDGSQVTFTYTPTGQRETVTDARGTTSYVYDDRDRLTEKTDPTGYKLSYAYDTQGNRTRLTATVGAQVFTTSYTYDVLNRIETVTDSQGGVTRLGYDENGNRGSLAHPNGVTTVYTYDDLNRLTHLETATAAGDLLRSYDYTLGLAGNRTRIDEHDGTSRHYTYDDLYRLTQDRVTDASAAQVYQRDFVYDPVGNRTSQTIQDDSGLTVVVSSYDDRDRLMSMGETTFGWDANGNMTSHNGTSYTWDFENRLTSVLLDHGTLIATVYDAEGNRVQTAVTAAGGVTETGDYLIDTSGFLSHVVAEIAGGSVRNRYTRAGDQLLDLYQQPSDTQRYYLVDGLGSVRMLTDESGALTDAYRYTAFGELLDASSEDLQPYQFAGEPYNALTGLTYHRERWLNAGGGRFISQDPIQGIATLPQSLNPYPYALGDPVLLKDPSGRFATIQERLIALGVTGQLVLLQLQASVGQIQTATINLLRSGTLFIRAIPGALRVGFQHANAGVYRAISEMVGRISPSVLNAWQNGVKSANTHYFHRAFIESERFVRITQRLRIPEFKLSPGEFARFTRLAEQIHRLPLGRSQWGEVFRRTVNGNTFTFVRTYASQGPGSPVVYSDLGVLVLRGSRGLATFRDAVGQNFLTGQ